MPVLKQISPTGAATPENSTVGQRDNGGRAGRSLAADRRFATQLIHGQTGSGADRGPMTRRDHAGVAPLADGLGGDTGKPRGLISATKPIDDIVDDWH
jgi:hypothetical protein